MTAPTLRSDKPAAILETSTAPRYGEPGSPTARAIGRFLRRAPVSVGALINRPARTATVRRASMPESRLLVALVVAASAAGPLIAALSGTAVGPLSVVRFLLTSPTPDAATVQAACTTSGVVEDCVGLPARLRLSGLGPAVMSVMPVLCLLVLADGLRRGRRFVWWGALVLNVVLGGLAAVQVLLTVSSPIERHLAFGGASDAQYATGVVAAMVHPYVIAALLLATRRRFFLLAFKAKFQPEYRPLYVSYPDVTALPAIGAALTRAYPPDPGTARAATLIRWLCRRES